MATFLGLPEEELMLKMREAIARLECVKKDDDVSIMSYEFTLSSRQGPDNNVKVKAAMRNHRVMEGEYILTWDGWGFYVHCVVYRQTKNYRIVSRQGRLDPFTDRVADEYREFAIAHLLQHLGYRKESVCYFVKACGEKPVRLLMRKDNFWGIGHYDFNCVRNFQPGMSQTWGGDRKPLYQPYDKTGFVCTCPTKEQMLTFCLRWGIALRNPDDAQTTIEDLVRACRERMKQPDAFRKYMRRD